MKHKEIKDYGYRSPRLDTTNYFSGTLPKTIINPTGDWRPFCPGYEPQFGDAGFETNDCTIFGTENGIQMYIKKMFGLEVNYSERFVSNGMNRDNSTGQDPQLPLEWIRKNGLVKQESLPMVFNMKEYQTPRPLTQKLIDEAKKWGFDLKHEYVFANNPSKQLRLVMLREHLKYSPIPCSVTAWYEDDNDIYIDNGAPNTHWAVLVYIDDEGYQYVYDSYDLIMNGVSTALIKKLSPDHHIEVAKRLYITKADVITEEQRQGFLTQLRALWDWVMSLKKIADALPVEKPVVSDPVIPIVPVTTTRDMIKEWANAIVPEEGGKINDRNMRNNNPGNLKYTDFTASLGSIYGALELFGVVKKDKDNFCIFESYDRGFKALYQFLKLGAQNQLKPYKKARTLYQFTEVFALPSKNHPYAANVARKLEVDVNVDIGTFIN